MNLNKQINFNHDEINTIQFVESNKVKEFLDDRKGKYVFSFRIFQITF